MRILSVVVRQGDNRGSVYLDWYWLLAVQALIRSWIIVASLAHVRAVVQIQNDVIVFLLEPVLKCLLIELDLVGR